MWPEEAKETHILVLIGRLGAMRVAERRATDAAFRRVAADLRARIREGSFANGVALPTELEVCRVYGVGRQTARRAFQDLVAEGLIYRVPGRGTFVSDSSTPYLRHFGSIEDLMGLSADSELEVVEPLKHVVDPLVAGRLGLPNDRVATVAFLRLHEGEVFCHSRVYLPPEASNLLGDVPELTTIGARSRVTIIGLLDRALSRPIEHAEQSVSVARASAEVASAFNAEVGTPMLRIDRVYAEAESTPVELAINHYLPERYSYRIRLQRSPG